MDQLVGRTVVITGATRGIGRAIALQLAQQHYQAVLSYGSDEQRAQEPFMRASR